jgi:predicted P-loop ATPase
MDFVKNVEDAEPGDVICIDSGDMGVKMSDGSVCWRQNDESEDWWLHRVASMHTMLMDIENRASDGTIAPGVIRGK